MSYLRDAAEALAREAQSQSLIDRCEAEAAVGKNNPATEPVVIDGHMEHTSAYTVYPRGLTDLSDFNAPNFLVQVMWRGEYKGRQGGGWSVSRGRIDLLASSADADHPQWDIPERFRRWQYRYPTFEEALTAARLVVDKLEINGRTWAQWEERKKTR